MKTNEYMEQTEQYVLHTYNRFPLVIDHGEGVHLYDTDGKAYLDFAAGIAVYALGYSNDDYKKAVKDQVDKVIHVSNLFYNVPMGSAAEKLAKASGMDKVFFTNSGPESIEGAIKVARKYAYLKDGNNDHEIIAMNHSFHGRSLGALSVTGNTHYQDPFKPLIGGIKFADFNDLESVKAQITDKTCAIIMETVQGEGGIYPATKEFLQGVRDLCDEHDILLILDEIGRGTSTFDGMSIARAVVEHISDPARGLGCKTLFATHYHELTELEGTLEGVKNYNIAVKKRGEDITFLRRIVRGPADDSYGIEVAKLAGLPGSVTRRAHEVLRTLEASAPKNKVEQMDFDALQEYNSPAVPSEMMEKLEALDVETLTPIEALNFLYELKKTLKGSLNG